MQFVVRDHCVDEKAGRLLRSLFERRGEADYGVDPDAPADANVAVNDAEVVVATIATWLDGRQA